MEIYEKLAPKDSRKPDISRRMTFDMRLVALDPAAIKSSELLYTVYRNLAIINGKIRYDITVMPPKKIGREFAKTFGHYHEGLFPELYEVLKGRAYFLLQKPASPAGKPENNPKKIKEIYIVEVAGGEKAVMPPGFGHLSINIGKNDLVLANWIGLVSYNYNLFQELRGGCYHILDSDEAIEFKKNPNYKTVPKLKKLRPKDVPDLGIQNGKEHPIWDLRNDPQKLEWLIKPEKYLDLLTIEKLYKEI